MNTFITLLLCPFWKFKDSVYSLQLHRKNMQNTAERIFINKYLQIFIFGWTNPLILHPYHIFSSSSRIHCVTSCARKSSSSATTDATVTRENKFRILNELSEEQIAAGPLSLCTDRQAACLSFNNYRTPRREGWEADELLISPLLPLHGSWLRHTWTDLGRWGGIGGKRGSCTSTRFTWERCTHMLLTYQHVKDSFGSSASGVRDIGISVSINPIKYRHVPPQCFL